MDNTSASNSASAGHGDSTRFRSAPVTADLLCVDVRAFILARELYVRPLVLVAAGLSAAAAVQLAVQDPALVGGLVLLRPELRPLGFFPGQAAAFAGGCQHGLKKALRFHEHDQASAKLQLCCAVKAAAAVMRTRVLWTLCGVAKQLKALLVVQFSRVICRKIPTQSRFEAKMGDMQAFCRVD